MLEVSNTLDFSKFFSRNLKKSDSICNPFLFGLFNENERKKHRHEKKKALLKIGTAESSKAHVLLETSTELVKLVAQLNELIQHRESDFAMFYHKDKDKWIALVLSN